MSVKRYSVSRDGATKLSPHFCVREFACNGGEDEVLIDSDLLPLLEAVREHFGAAVTIRSGYRSPAYNASIGGKKNSYHTKGQAVDIEVKGVNPREVARYVEATLKPGGLGLYDYPASASKAGFVHIDTRTGRVWRGVQTDPKGSNRSVSSITADYLDKGSAGDAPTLRQGARGEAVKRMQLRLNALGYDAGKADGDFGTRTLIALRDFQHAKGLVADGVCGPKTWEKLG